MRELKHRRGPTHVSAARREPRVGKRALNDRGTGAVAALLGVERTAERSCEQLCSHALAVQPARAHVGVAERVRKHEPRRVRRVARLQLRVREDAPAGERENGRRERPHARAPPCARWSATASESGGRWEGGGACPGRAPALPARPAHYFRVALLKGS